MNEVLEVAEYYKCKGDIMGFGLRNINDLTINDVTIFNGNRSELAIAPNSPTWTVNPNLVNDFHKRMEENLVNSNISNVPKTTINLAKDYNFSGDILFDHSMIQEMILYPYKIKSIDVKVPNKVMIVKFVDGKEIKVVCDKDDEFSVERGLYIAIAKKKFGTTHTTEGIEYEADKLKHLKEYVKYVKDGVKLYYKDLEEKQKKLDEEERIKKYKAKRKAYKQRRAERKRNEKIDLIASAIKKANFSTEDDLK